MLKIMYIRAQATDNQNKVSPHPPHPFETDNKERHKETCQFVTKTGEIYDLHLPNDKTGLVSCTVTNLTLSV